MSRFKETLYRIKILFLPIPKVVGPEIGSEISVGGKNKSKQVPVVSLNESQIGPINNPHPTSERIKTTLQPWTGQGEQADSASSLRPTEDEALDNLEQQGY